MVMVVEQIGMQNAHYRGRWGDGILTAGTDGLSIEVPGDIRLGLALHLAQDGGLLALLDRHHGGIFRECNFLCACVWVCVCVRGGKTMQY